MTETTTLETPCEIDTALAAVYNEKHRLMDRRALNYMDLQRLAGAQFRYVSRKRRVTDMTITEAIEIVQAEVAKLAAHREAHPEDYYRIPCGTNLAFHQQDQAERALANVTEYDEQIADLEEQARELGALYTGWSRFFLVTSSSGHVHSSMSCSTCRPTTRFGWLPSLSGQDEAEAVAELGPTLCTVCFPSAPVEFTEGKKITAAQAAKKVA